MEYSAPGVYVLELPITPKPIEGVPTSTAAFIGRALDGPADHAVLCRSHADFVTNFNGADPRSELDRAIR